jgi:hypothetical protein
VIVVIVEREVLCGAKINPVVGCARRGEKKREKERYAS